MKKLQVVLLFLAVCGGLQAQCLAGGLAVIVPKSNPADGLSVAQLRKLVMGDVRVWPDKNKVTLISMDVESPIFKCLLTEAVRMTLPEYRKYLLNAEFRGDDPLHLTTVTSTASALRNVAALTGAFAVVEASTVAAQGSGVKVLSINGKQPGEPGYPLP